MDFKDVIIISATIIFVVLTIKFMPNNPLSIMTNYIKTCFKIKVNN